MAPAKSRQRRVSDAGVDPNDESEEAEEMRRSILDKFRKHFRYTTTTPFGLAQRTVVV